jgi:hypothetical protein
MAKSATLSESALDQQIASLEEQLAQLRRQKITILQDRLREMIAQVGGSPAPASAPAAAAAPAAKAPAARGGKRKGPKGRRLKEAEVVERLAREVQAAGKEGVSARAAAQKAGIFYLRAIKVMTKHFKKTGTGKWTRYTMK